MSDQLPYAYDDSKVYYARGFGMMHLYGALEYSEFSKAVFGDEETIGTNPDLIYTYNEEDEFQFLPLAVLMWRYMQSYHSALPSPHDVVTGFWTPNEAEVEAGLAGPADFCSLAAIVATNYGMAMYERRLYGDSIENANWGDLMQYSGLSDNGWDDSA